MTVHIALNRFLRVYRFLGSIVKSLRYYLDFICFLIYNCTYLGFDLPYDRINRKRWRSQSWKTFDRCCTYCPPCTRRPPRPSE